MLTPSFFVISDPLFLEWKHNIRCNITTASRHRTIASTWSSMVLFLFVQFSQTLTFFNFFAILPWLLPSPVPYKWGVFFWASLNLENWILRKLETSVQYEPCSCHRFYQYDLFWLSLRFRFQRCRFRPYRPFDSRDTANALNGPHDCTRVVPQHDKPIL